MFMHRKFSECAVKLCKMCTKIQAENIILKIYRWYKAMSTVFAIRHFDIICNSELTTTVNKLSIQQKNRYNASQFVSIQSHQMIEVHLFHSFS